MFIPSACRGRKRVSDPPGTGVTDGLVTTRVLGAEPRFSGEHQMLLITEIFFLAPYFTFYYYCRRYMCHVHVWKLGHKDLVCLSTSMCFLRMEFIS